jgi:DNA helicase-2/ATP-dependent DNA helicase PcrA
MCEPSRFISEIPEKLIDFPRRSVPIKESFNNSDNFSNMLQGLNLPPMKFNARKPLKLSSEPGSSPPPSKPLVPPVNPAVSAIPPADIEEIRVGMDVEHERFGKGKVIGIEGIGPNKKATVFFPEIGQKQLLLKFAKLRIAE